MVWRGAGGQVCIVVLASGSIEGWVVARRMSRFSVASPS
jgi:hypothetical protein